jgi:hypothetical protein
MGKAPVVHDRRENIVFALWIEAPLEAKVHGSVRAVCGSACKIDPHLGVIGIQK